MNFHRYTLKRALISLTLLVSMAAEAEILFESSFDSGDISEAEWVIDKEKQCDIQVAHDFGRNGQASARFEAGPGARCEILPWFYSNFVTKQLREPYGEDRWYAFSVFLEEEWVSNHCSGHNRCNEVIAQWHSSKDVFMNEPSGRGPPLALRILGDVWRITYGWDTDFLSKEGGKAIYPLWISTIQPGQWTDWVFRVRWTRGSEDGLVQVWLNGEMVVDHTGSVGYNDIRGNYLKLGSYHPRTKRLLYIDEIRIGDEEESYETMKPRTRNVP